MLWLGAIVGRTLNSNEEAVRYFYALGAYFKVGPPLYHQTFANVLDELHRYDESLPHRQAAVKLYPAGWSYDGMGNTLSAMHRYDRAEAAGAKAVSASPGQWLYWQNYGNTAWQQKHFADAETRYRRALTLNPTAPTARFWLADSLDKQGKLDEALKEYELLARQRPKDLTVQLRISDVTDRLESAATTRR